MVNIIIRKQTWLLAILVGSLMLSLAISSVQAETDPTQSDDRILFLHLQIKNSIVTLIDSKLVNGKLKISKIPSQKIGIALNANSGSSQNYYSEIIDNPLIKRYEYEDPDNAGQLITKLVMLDETEFWVRLPYANDLNSVSFSLTDGQPESFSKGRAVIESVVDLSSLSESSK